MEPARTKKRLSRKLLNSLPTTWWPGTCCKWTTHPKKGIQMTNATPRTVPLGELVLTVFDKAAQYSADPREVSLLATQTISHMLWHTPRLKTLRQLRSTVS